MGGVKKLEQRTYELAAAAYPPATAAASPHHLPRRIPLTFRCHLLEPGFKKLMRRVKSKTA